MHTLYQVLLDCLFKGQLTEQVPFDSPELSRCAEGEVILPWGISLHSLGNNQVRRVT